ncbi:MAG: aminodeoxychorismate synthase component I [Porticoccaceae bacterium]|jgi:para-aminobenzoate synthetase component 1|nr:aminodeoxychorismate synthase component I [Porticoccaceae bacterium]HLS98575.1 aminodeoxychorismate synthase component I [Porticoccaceae bacterium]
MAAAPEIIDFPYQAEVAPLFARLRHLDGAIWLDSGKPRSLQGRFDIITALPQWWLQAGRDGTRLSRADGTLEPCAADPFRAADELLATQGLVGESHAHLPFVGGLMGYWRYDLGSSLLGLPPAPGGEPPLPGMKLGWYGWGLIINHQARRGWLVFHPACQPTARERILACLNGAESPPPAPFRLTAPFSPTIPRAQYLAAIAAIAQYIAAGDCYQVNFAQGFAAPCEGDPWAAYQVLRRALPSPYGAYLNWDGEALLSCSPERFLKVSLGQVETKPIKGTIPRGRTLAEDEDNAVALMNSTKDRAENLMIVDLLRNDLGKHCRPGSIRVPKLFALESFANVHHLVSTVTGTLAPDSTPLDLLRDAFPGGSITGAPKKRAMEIIAELEPSPRGIYCGSIGYMSANGRLDTNIAIRTLTARDGRIHCFGGGGIVADSVAEREYEESVQKVAVLMRALEGDVSRDG